MESQEKQLTKQEIQTLFELGQFISYISFQSQNSLNQEQYAQLQKCFDSTQIEQYETICVQCFYVIYICLSKNIFPQLHQQFIAYSHRLERPCLLFSKLIAQKDIRDIMGDKVPYFTLYSRIIKTIIELISKNTKKTQNTNQQIKQNQNQIQPKLSELRKLQYFQQTMQNLLQKQLTDKQCFVELEHSLIVKQYSILYTFQNYSIALMIFREESMMKQFKQFKEHEQKLHMILKHKKMLKKKYEESYQIQLQIEQNYYKYFQTFKTNPIFVKTYDSDNMMIALDSYKDNRKINKNNNKYIERRKMKIKLKIKPISQKCKYEDPSKYQQIKQLFNQTIINKESQKKFIQCQIQYIHDQRSIIVRLNPDIVLQSQVVNEMLYKWSTLTFHNSLISLQILDKNQLHIKKKQLLIKGVSQISPDQSLITKTLKLIDITIAAYLPIQKLVNQKKDNEIKEHITFKLQDNCERVIHYMKIANKLSQQIYV